MKNPERLMRQLRSAPRDPEIEKLKSLFDALNAFISRNNGWVTSVRGDPELRFDVLPDSALPGELRSRGYVVTEIGEGERILPAAITQQFTLRADGEFEPATAESTRPIASTRTHAGIVRVKRTPSACPDARSKLLLAGRKTFARKAAM